MMMSIVDATAASSSSSSTLCRRRLLICADAGAARELTQTRTEEADIVCTACTACMDTVCAHRVLSPHTLNT